MYVVLLGGGQRHWPSVFHLCCLRGACPGNTLCLQGDLSVAGRLREFLSFWEITSDKWVLDILKQGINSIELLHIPHFAGVQSTRPPSLGTDVLSSKVDGLLRKHAILPVPLDQERDRYFSTYFIVPRRIGDFDQS